MYCTVLYVYSASRLWTKPRAGFPCFMLATQVRCSHLWSIFPHLRGTPLFLNVYNRSESLLTYCSRYMLFAGLCRPLFLQFLGLKPQTKRPRNSHFFRPANLKNTVRLLLQTKHNKTSNTKMVKPFTLFTNVYSTGLLSFLTVIVVGQIFIWLASCRSLRLHLGRVVVAPPGGWRPSINGPRMAPVNKELHIDIKSPLWSPPTVKPWLLPTRAWLVIFNLTSMLRKTRSTTVYQHLPHALRWLGCYRHWMLRPFACLLPFACARASWTKDSHVPPV
jgi:hypothetical protein